MKLFYICLLLFSVFLIGCEEEALLHISNTRSLLVVDGMITNTTKDNYIRLCLTDIDTILPFLQEVKRVPVNDALVVVSDNLGYSETLTAVKEWDYAFNDSIYNGLYPIRYIEGIPGNTYYLYIKYQNIEYSAESFLQPVPEIDSLYYGKIYNPAKGEYYYPPLINYKEPQNEENHYLFIFSLFSVNDSLIDYQHLSGNGSLDITIMSDEFLEPYVSGLDVAGGYSSSYWLKGYSWTAPGDPVYIRMYSLSLEGYKFWKTITEQIESEGGIFNPAPSTPPGNISGGALGLFQASAVSSIKGEIPYDIGK